MHLVSYFWDSEIHLGNLAFGIELCGCVIDLVVAIVAVVTLPTEWTKKRKERVRHQFELFGAIATFTFLVALFSNHRIAVLQDERTSLAISTLKPGKQPIADMSATVSLTVRPPKIIDPVWAAGRSSNGPGWIAELTFFKSTNFGSFRFSPLIADTYSSSWQFGIPTHYLQFRLHPIFSSRNLGLGMPSEDIDELDAIRLSAYFLPPETEVVGGSATLTVNSIIRKTFPIPPQKIEFNEITSIILNGTNAMPVIWVTAPGK